MIKKKINAALVVGSLITGTVAWYATSVYARGGRRQELNSGLGKGYGYSEMLQMKSEILEMSTDELQKELGTGNSMYDIVTEKGLTPEEFHQKILAVERKRLENLVEAGLLTQEQLKRRIQLMEQRQADCEEYCGEYRIGRKERPTRERINKSMGMRGSR